MASPLVADYSSDSSEGAREEKTDPKETKTKEKNYLAAHSFSSTSTSDSESNDTDEDNVTNLNEQTSDGKKLPVPFASEKNFKSVFTIPYKEAEKTRNAILEKHVKLTEKVIEKKFKKKDYKGKKKGKMQVFTGRDDDDNGGSMAKRHKVRVGVSNSLIPPKRFMSTYKPSSSSR